jgi:uncharacterized protein
VADAGRTLDAKVAALRLPSAYPGCRQPVEAIETHMSWVFLTPDHAYKLKKPVRADGLDFSTIERRHFFCGEEVRLNRRLAPSVYLQVLPLCEGADGAIHAGGPGQTIDWLVWMRRLPAALMLDQLLARGQARPEHLRQVAQLLCAFYGHSSPALRDVDVYRARLAAEIDEHEGRLCDPGLGFDVARVQQVCSQLRRYVHRHGDVLGARVRAGRIVEGHGDLRPEHIWLGTPVAIIDCLEFSPDLRTLDSVDELGFLALECERAQAPEFARVLLARAVELCGDAPPPGLIDFYQALRACVRGGIALWHLKEPRYRGAPVWRQRAGDYLALAATHARRCLDLG